MRNLEEFIEDEILRFQETHVGILTSTRMLACYLAEKIERNMLDFI